MLGTSDLYVHCSNHLRTVAPDAISCIGSRRGTSNAAMATASIHATDMIHVTLAIGPTFLSRSATLTRDLAIGGVSVRPSVCL